jgi:coenzyme F420 hydrogenase subunit beta
MEPERNFGIQDVVDRDMCIGCGACAIISNNKIPVQINSRGFFQASLESVDQVEIERADKVCPIADTSTSEDQMGTRYFPTLAYNEHVGRAGVSFAGRVISETDAIRSSAGGITTHLLTELASLGLVDGVIHMKAPNSSKNGLFEYQVSRSLAEIDSSRKSLYYASTLAEVLLQVADDELTYALVGVPCFIKAGRLLVEQDPRFKEKIKYFVGLVCGHMKSTFFAESLAWQAGINPRNLEAIDFREKINGSPSNKYGYSAKSREMEERKVKLMSETVDGNWGLGVFQPEGCNFCDDIFADSADIVFGDAWLPQYVSEWQGTNVVIARNEELLEIIQNSRKNGKIDLNEIPLELVIQSQSGNFRHRRDGLKVRLEDDKRLNLKIPVRRVAPGYSNLPKHRINLIRSRRRLSRMSFIYFAKAKKFNSIKFYELIMRFEKTIHKVRMLSINPRKIVKFLK